jgi:hypothetical protein
LLGRVGGQGDKETRRQGDKETRRQGDKETRAPTLPHSHTPKIAVARILTVRATGVIFPADIYPFLKDTPMHCFFAKQLKRSKKPAARSG